MVFSCIQAQRNVYIAFLCFVISFVMLPSFLVMCVYSLMTGKIMLCVLEWRLPHPPYLKDCTEKREGTLGKKQKKHLKILQFNMSGGE